MFHPAPPSGRRAARGLKTARRPPIAFSPHVFNGAPTPPTHDGPLTERHQAYSGFWINYENVENGCRRQKTRGCFETGSRPRGLRKRAAPGGAAHPQLEPDGDAAAQLDAEVLDGTRVRTVLRFSPRAAVFAIDPFAGQLAVYDPSLSDLVTHELPSFGLPLRADAVIDDRHLFASL